MTRISKSYEACHDHLKKGRVDSGAWEKAGYEKDLTLLIGAGATSCLVGNWNELLNELAVMRSVAGQDKLTQQEMRDYLDRNCSGKFFGDDIFVLEKGEYLRYSPTDQQMLSSKEKQEQWREKVFAGRVFCAVERLIRRHLLDGAGMHQKENYKADFMDWCLNKKETPFELERKILCQNKKVEAQLEKMDAKTIAAKLDLYYGTACDAGEIEKKIQCRR